MLRVRLTSLALGFLLSANAWALDLRQGDLFRGRIHLGKSVGQSCHISIQKEVVKGSERTFNLLVYKNNYLAGRSFREARNYETNMTAKGSTYLTLKKDRDGRYITETNPNETLHIDIKNQTIESVRIYVGEKVIVNCVGMKRVDRN